ncbi:hypothetical protein MA20_11730 [Bradyrhizobium japonicum]|uniref:Uncharacterized protein n=2 Tax=Bradyrhizobium japonicum TaxID=375 RepID=A0A0A3Y2G3_BRAJP|nr:hypothetical protein MA20_11730 [Bradyrhizobium japonicum]
MRLAFRRPGIGRLVSGLVVQMTTKTCGERSSGNCHETLEEGSGADFCNESQFDEKVAEFGLEPIKAARVARVKKKVSEAAEAKRKYRAQRKAEGFGQYVVEVPVDEDAKRTVYAVAQAIVDDQTNSRNMRSIILSVVSSPALLKLHEVLSTSSVNVSSIVELIERGELDKIVEIYALRPALLPDLLRLAKSDTDFLSVLECLVRHEKGISEGSAKGLLEAAVIANDCPEVLRFLEVRQRGGLRGRLLGWALGNIQ